MIFVGQREKVSDFSKRDREMKLSSLSLSLCSFLFLGLLCYYKVLDFDWVVGWLGQGMHLLEDIVNSNLSHVYEMLYDLLLLLFFNIKIPFCSGI